MSDPALLQATADDAIAYFLAARKIATGEHEVAIIAIYRMPWNFLLGHCCELALKALLLTAKGSLGKARDQHDIAALVRACEAAGVTLEPGFFEYCRVMGPAHRWSAFRYADRGTGQGWIGKDDAFSLIAPQLARLPSSMTIYLHGSSK